MFFPLLIKIADFAPDIPDRSVYGDLAALEPGQFFDWAVKEHISQRAGRHYDIRLGNPEIGLLSWATKKELPQYSGEMIALFQQPVHAYEYLTFEGTLPPGYGHGPVKTVQQGRILVTDISKNQIDFTVDRGRWIERYKLIKAPEKHKWYFLRVEPGIQIPEKKKFKLIDDEEAKELIKHIGQQIAAVQPKVDGAMTYVIITKSGRVELVSPRISKVTGGPIFYTEKVSPKIIRTDAPRTLRGTILIGELYGVQKTKDGERVIPPNELAAILNAGLENARKILAEKNIDLRIMLFDVAEHPKEGIRADNYFNVPYETRRKILQELINYLPSKFHLSPEASEEQDAKRLLQAIIKNRYPLTSEGAIFYPQKGIPYKFKTYQDGDFYIVGFTEGAGRLKGKAIGGVLISDKPNGEPIAVVGSGFTDELRKMIYENPNEYIGRKITVKFQERTPSGSLRAPVFLSFAD